MRFLFIQILALGDLILTTPALAGLRVFHPEAGIAVLANQAFAPALHGNPAVDRFIPFPYRRLYQAANLPETEAVTRGLADLAGFAAALPRDWDRVYNPNFNDMGGALSRLSRGREVVGSDLTPGGALVMRGDWPAYMLGVIAEKTLNPFHLADLHCLALGVRPPRPGLVWPLSEEDRREAAVLLQSLGAGAGENLVGIQVGAGRGERCWPAGHFRELALRLAARGFRPVFLGIESERPQALEAARGVPGAVTAAGLTRLPVLGGLLSHCRALISNDTGTIHLAAALGVPNLTIMLAGASPWGTGPYLPGSLALTSTLSCAPCNDPRSCPRGLACRKSITPGDAWAAWRILEGREGTLPQGSGARLHQAFRTPEGLLSWRPLSPDPEAGIRTALGRGWLAALRPGGGLAAPPADPPPPGEESPLAGLDRLLTGNIEILGEILGGLERGLAPGPRQIQDLLRGEDEIRRLGLAGGPAKPLVLYMMNRPTEVEAANPGEELAARLKAALQVRIVARLAAPGL